MREPVPVFGQTLTRQSRIGQPLAPIPVIAFGESQPILVHDVQAWAPFRYWVLYGVYHGSTHHAPARINTTPGGHTCRRPLVDGKGPEGVWLP